NSPGTYSPSSGLATSFTAGTPLNNTQLSNFVSFPTYNEIWGVAVTNNLFTGTHPKTNFTRPEVAAILTGQYSNWNQLRADDGTQLSAGAIVLVHRAPGISTEAGSNLYFLGYPPNVTNLPNNITFFAGNVYNVVAPATIANPCTLTSSGYVDINE